MYCKYYLKRVIIKINLIVIIFLKVLLTVVSILGPTKCALSLDVPYTWFNDWPDDECMSRNMSPRL